MSRSERWSNANEIRRTFHDIEDPAVGAGPILCTVKGRKYTECDVNYEGGYRQTDRIIFSNDGLVYYTQDHYETFTLLYGEE